jgi:ABC-type nitrate/sulfonate/bicarbonate transport system substrate-binding protein
MLSGNSPGFRAAPACRQLERFTRLKRPEAAHLMEETMRNAKQSVSVAALACALVLGRGAAATAADCPNGLRDLRIGVSVVPPNVVHTTPYVAKDLGIFEKYCIAATIVAFEGGSSAAAVSSLQSGRVVATVTDVMAGSGMKVKQIWGFAPRLPQAYTVSAGIDSPKDLKGKRLSAAGGIGSFNWSIGRLLLTEGGLTLDDAKFVSQGLAGRLPGLLTGQLDGAALHPEDVYLALKKPGLHVLTVLANQLPNYVFNQYGAAESFIARDRPLLIDAMAAMIETNRLIYSDKEKVLPSMIRATEKSREEVEYAWSELTRNCVWAVNVGFDKARTEWSIKNSVEVGDIPAARNLTFEELVDLPLAEAAVQKAGGPVKIGNCSL